MLITQEKRKEMRREEKRREEKRKNAELLSNE
jgi:hypothetical protein